MTRFLLPILFLAVPALAHAAPPRDMLLLAWSGSGAHALVRESVQGEDGGALVSYRVVGPGVLQQRHEVSDDRAAFDEPRRQRISNDACRKALLELKKMLVDTRFFGVGLRGDHCTVNRAEVVSVSPELASAAEFSELLPEGEELVKDDLRVRIERESLVLQSPKAKKRLRLPRPIPPEATHLLLAPTRRLLLVLVSAPSGEQVMTAGFSSKTGELADFQ